MPNLTIQLYNNFEFIYKISRIADLKGFFKVFLTII